MFALPGCYLRGTERTTQRLTQLARSPSSQRASERRFVSPPRRVRALLYDRMSSHGGAPVRMRERLRPGSRCGTLKVRSDHYYCRKCMTKHKKIMHVFFF